MTALIVTPAALRDGEVRVEGDTYRHLFRAKRLAVGDRLRVVDGEGRARHGEIAAVGRRQATVILQGEAPALEAALRLELWVAPPRPQRAAWLVEKATELGVHAVRFVASTRTSRQWGEEVMARLARVARAAVEQCGRSRIPEVTGVHGWSDLPALVAATEARFVLHPTASRPLTSLNGEASPVAVLVGPEGGWTEEELAELRAADCRDLGLGPRILRTETAALAAATIGLSGGTAD